MPQKIHATAAITVVTIALILMLTFKLDSFKLRANLLSEALAHQRQRKENPVIIKSRNSINNLEKELSFLNPEILKCEEIFEKGQNRSEFEHIWSELKNYNRVLKTVKNELKAKNITKKCCEGYSYRYAEEGQIMAKLARWVKKLLIF